MRPPSAPRDTATSIEGGSKLGRTYQEEEEAHRSTTMAAMCKKREEQVRIQVVFAIVSLKIERF